MLVALAGGAARRELLLLLALADGLEGCLEPGALLGDGGELELDLLAARGDALEELGGALEGLGQLGRAGRGGRRRARSVLGAALWCFVFVDFCGARGRWWWRSRGGGEREKQRRKKN